MTRLSYGAAQFRWAQAGFLPDTPAGETPRNLMGFKDGTNNPRSTDRPRRPTLRASFDEVVWVGEEGPDWMRGGSYLVARRIRISLEHWDRTEVDFQEQVIGRHKYSGAPIGKASERDALDLDRADKDGNPVIADNVACPARRRARPTTARRSSAGPIPTTTASASPPSAGRPGARA